MSAPRISVIVPARDAQSTLPALLAALLAQASARDDAEVIVVDSGSSDRTGDLARAAGAVVVRESRPGASTARNAGLRVARGELIAFTDSDCIPQPGWLDELVSEFDHAPETGACGGPVVAAPPSGLIQRYAERAGHVSQETAVGDPFLPYLVTANCAYRRHVLDALGGFSEELRNGEDTEVAWRMQLELGLDVSYVPGAVVQHVHRSTLRGIWRQWVRVGWGSVQLAERFPNRPGMRGGGPHRAIVRLLAELGRGVRAQLRLPLGRADPLDVVAPMLRCLEIVADRFGRFQAGFAWRRAQHIGPLRAWRLAHRRRSPPAAPAQGLRETVGAQASALPRGGRRLPRPRGKRGPRP
jgi:GT2 family glycosyltransferase